MLRAVLVIAILIAGAIVALWQFDLLRLPFGQGGLATQQSVPDLLEAAARGNPDDIAEALAAGVPVDTADGAGRTALMLAASEQPSAAVVGRLVAAGANLNARDDIGMTPLMYAARDASAPEAVLLLMQAGADASARNAEGLGAWDYAARNPAIAGTILLARLDELKDGPFDTNWPSGYVVPVTGATISSRISHLPGALRAYRNGRHEGFDFYSGTVSVPIDYGTPIVAVAGGTVIRADLEYVEMTQQEYDNVIAASRASISTPEDMLDLLRGRQVWIEHPGGFVSRYAHLSGILPGVHVGAFVAQGQEIALTGNSGTEEAVLNTQDDPHPHVEIWRGDIYLGAGMEPDDIYELAAQVFGRSALPPFREQ